MRRPISLDVLLPLAVLLLLTALFRATDWDLALAKRFFSAETGWTLVEGQPWRFLYDHGPKPGVSLGVGALALLLTSLLARSLVRHRRSALFLVLALLVGPGLLVNAVLRDHWGRPRPRDLALFGGEASHWRVLEWRPGGTGHSFPSGHASSAFFLFAPFFLLRRTRRRWAIFFLVLGVLYGVLMGIARMGQGAHFASDVAWAGGITYFTCLGIARLLRAGEPVKDRSAGSADHRRAARNEAA